MVRDMRVEVSPVSNQLRETQGLPTWIKRVLQSKDGPLLLRALALPHNDPAWSYITLETVGFDPGYP